MKRFFIVPLLLIFFAVPGLSQNNDDEDLQAVMEKLARDAGKAYVAPMTSGFGVNLNSGWFHRAPSAKTFGFDLEFGVVAMATLFREENKMFSSSGEFQFDFDQADLLAQQAWQSAGSPASPTQNDVRTAIINQIFRVSFDGPTVIGRETDSLHVVFPGKQINVNSFNFNLPAQSFTLGVTGLLEEAPALPLAAPQLTIGTIFGTQFTFRYLPEIKIDDQIGNFKYFGFGIQHNPMIWLGGEDVLPFDVAVGYFTQSMHVGSLMEAKATAFGLNTSIRLGWGFLNITPYAGFMLESSSISFAYDYSINDSGNNPVQQRVTFDAEGENTSRATFGASIKILFINVNADINLGKYKAFSGGIMIII